MINKWVNIFKSLTFSHGHDSFYYSTIVANTNMKNLTEKVRKILTMLIKIYIKEFLYALWIRLVTEVKPSDSKSTFYATSQEERK